jgi:hypothetical protein
MVYNFSLPPLLLDAVMRGDAGHLCRWAASLEDPGDGASYFNFCASHDGVGLTPTHGILSDGEREALIETVLARGGRISYKATAEGKIPYEMTSTTSRPRRTLSCRTRSVPISFLPLRR